MKIQRAAAAAAALAAAGGAVANNNNTADRNQNQNQHHQDHHNSPAVAATTTTATTSTYLQDTRTHVVGELYDTERSYVESLQILIEKYMKPLKNLDSSRAPLIESNLVDEIFYTIPEILHHHESFLSALQERLSSDWDSSQVIGNVFIEAFTNQQVIDTYTAFINNWKNARQAIKVAIQAKPAFERFLEAMSREHRNKLTLDALLIMPVQRIPRYELLIKELIKHTPDDHPDYGPLIEAQQKIHELALKIDQAEREMIHQEQLRDLESLIEGHVELQHPQRDFIRYDLVTISASTLTVAKKERVLFLFCDLLIITSVKKKVSRRSNLQAAFYNSTNDISLLEGNKFKLILRVSLDQIEVRHDNKDQQAAQYWQQRQQVQLQRQYEQNQLSEQQQHQIQLSGVQLKKLIEDKRQELESDLCLLQQIDIISNQMRQVDKSRLNESISELANELRLNLNTLDRQQIDCENFTKQQQQQRQLSALQHSAQLVKDLYLIQAAPPSCYQVPEETTATATEATAAAATSLTSANQNQLLNSGDGANLSLPLQPSSNSDTTDQHHHYHYQNTRAFASQPSSSSQAPPPPPPLSSSSSTTATPTISAASSAQQTEAASIEFIINNSVPSRDSNTLGSTSVISEMNEQQLAAAGPLPGQSHLIPDSSAGQSQQHQQQLTSSSSVNNGTRNYETLVVTFASKDRRQAFLQAFLEAKQARFNQIAQQQQQQHQQRMLAMSSPSNSNSMSIKLSHASDSAAAAASAANTSLIKSQSIASDMRRTRLRHQDEIFEMRLSDSCVRGGSGSGVSTISDKRQEDRNSSAPCVGTIVHQMSAPQVSLGRNSDENRCGQNTQSGMATTACCATCNLTPSAMAGSDKGLHIATVTRCNQTHHQHQQQQLQHSNSSHHYHHHHQLIHQPASQPALLQTICCHEQHNDSDNLIKTTTLGARENGLQIDEHSMLTPHDQCRLQSLHLDAGAGYRASGSLAHQCNDLSLAKQMEQVAANQNILMLEFAPKFLLTLPIDFLHTQQPALQFACSVPRIAAQTRGSSRAAAAASQQKCQTISDNSGQLWLCMSNGYVSHVALVFFVKKRLASGEDKTNDSRNANGLASNSECYTVVPIVQSSGDICKSQINCAAQVSWFKPVVRAKKPNNNNNIGRGSQEERRAKIFEIGSVDEDSQIGGQESGGAIDSSLLDSSSKQKRERSEAPSDQHQGIRKTPSFSIKAASPPVDIANLRKGGSGAQYDNCDSRDQATNEQQTGEQHKESSAISKSAPSRSLLDDSLDHSELFKRVGSLSAERAKVISRANIIADVSDGSHQSTDQPNSGTGGRRSSREINPKWLRCNLGARQGQRAPASHVKAHLHHSHDQLRSRNYHRPPVAVGAAAATAASVQPMVQSNCIRCNQHQTLQHGLVGHQQQHPHNLFHHYHHHHHHHHHHNLHHGHSHHHGHLLRQPHQASGSGSGHHHHHMYYNKHHTVALGELRKALERQSRICDDKNQLLPSGGGGRAGAAAARKQHWHLVPPTNTPCQPGGGSQEFNSSNNNSNDDDDADDDNGGQADRGAKKRARKKVDKKARSATPPARYGADTTYGGGGGVFGQQYKSLRSAKLLRHQASLKTSSILAKLVGTASRGSSYLRKSSHSTLGATPNTAAAADKMQSDADDTDTDSGNVKARGGGGGNSSSNDSNSLLAGPMQQLAYGQGNNNKLQVLGNTSSSNPNMAINTAPIVSPMSSVSSLNSTNSSITVNSACASSPARSSCSIFIDHPRNLSRSFCCPLSSLPATQSSAQDDGGAGDACSAIAHLDHHYHHHRVDGDDNLTDAMILRGRSATVPCRAYCTGAYAGADANELADATVQGQLAAAAANAAASVHNICPITLTHCLGDATAAEQLQGGSALGQSYKISDIVSDSVRESDQKSNHNQAANQVDAEADVDCDTATSVTSLWVGCDDGSLVVIDCMAELDLKAMATEAAAAQSDANPYDICVNKTNSSSSNRCQNVHSEIKLSAPISDISNYKDQIVFVALASGQLAVFSRLPISDIATAAATTDDNNNGSSNTEGSNNNSGSGGGNNDDDSSAKADKNKQANDDDDNDDDNSSWWRQQLLQHGQWSLANPQILTITTNELNLTSKLCLVNDEHLWYAYGRNIYVLDIHTLKLITTIMTPTSDKSIQFAIQSTTIDSMELVRHLDGVWIAFKCSPLIQLYGYRDYRLLLEISLFEPINKVLSCGNEIIRQHKTTCLGTTALLNIYNETDQSNSLFVGTSAGIIIYLPVHTDQLRAQIEADKSVWSPQVISLRHGHSGQVKFMRLIELSGGEAEGEAKKNSATTLLGAAGSGSNDGGPPIKAAPGGNVSNDQQQQQQRAAANSDGVDSGDNGARRGGHDEARSEEPMRAKGNLYLVSGGAGIDFYGPNSSQQVVQHLSGDDDHLNHLILWQL